MNEMTTATTEAVRRPWRWLRHHHPVRWALLVAALAVAGVFLAPKFEQAVRAYRQLQGVQLRWVWLSLAGELASLFAFSMVTWVLLDPRTRPRFHRLVLVDLSTVAMSHAVPAGAAAGTALGYELLEAEGVRAVEAGFAKVTQGLMSGMLLEFLLGAALGLQVLLYGPSEANLGLAAAGLVMVVGIAGFSYFLSQSPGVIKAVARKLIGWVPRVPTRLIDRTIDELSVRMADVVHQPGRLLSMCVWSLANWVFDLVSLWAALRAFGGSVNPVLLTVAFCVSQMAAMLPISPAGLGVVESALVPLLAAFGLSADVAVLGTLLWRLFNFWLPLPLGLGTYITLRVTRRRAAAQGGRPIAPEPASAS